MFRVDHATGATTDPGTTPATQSQPRFFQAGDTIAGTLATVVQAEWLNMMQEELCNAVTASGQVLDKSNRNQLSQALGIGNYVLKTGDAMTGYLRMLGGGNGIRYESPSTPIYGPWLDNAVAFGWDGANVRVRVDDFDVGNIAVNIVAGNFVQKAGDTMTGPLTVQQNVYTYNVYAHAGASWAGSSLGVGATGNDQWELTADVGGTLYIRPVQGGAIGAGITITLGGELTGPANINAANLLADAGTVRGATVQSNGDVIAVGNVQAANVFAAGDVFGTNVLADAGIVRGGTVLGNGAVTSGANVNIAVASAAGFYIAHDPNLGPARVLNFNTAFYLAWRENNAEYAFGDGGANAWLRIVGGNIGIPGIGYAGAGWVTGILPPLMRSNVISYEAGLSEVCRLRPVKYQTKGLATTFNMVDEASIVGVIPEDNLDVIPEMFGIKPAAFRIDGSDETDLYAVDQAPLLYAMVNAFKELAARVMALEGSATA